MTATTRKDHEMLENLLALLTLFTTLTLAACGVQPEAPEVTQGAYDIITSNVTGQKYYTASLTGATAPPGTAYQWDNFTTVACGLPNDSNPDPTIGPRTPQGYTAVLICGTRETLLHASDGSSYIARVDPYFLNGGSYYGYRCVSSCPTSPTFGAAPISALPYCSSYLGSPSKWGWLYPQLKRGICSTPSLALCEFEAGDGRPDLGIPPSYVLLAGACKWDDSTKCVNETTCGAVFDRDPQPDADRYGNHWTWQ